MTQAQYEKISEISETTEQIMSMIVSYVPEDHDKHFIMDLMKSMIHHERLDAATIAIENVVMYTTDKHVI